MTDEERIEEVNEANHAALRDAYGEQEPMHYGSMIGWRIGGPDPLDGVSIYWHPEGHWHYVGFGMTELAEKETNNPNVSGWGFELTFRLRAPPEVSTAEAAPTWPIVLLNDFARYVFDQRKPLAHGHYVERPGDPRSPYWGVVQDPVLRSVRTINGAFRWLLLVAMDEADFRRLQGDDYEAFLAEYATRNRLFVSSVAYGGG